MEESSFTKSTSVCRNPEVMSREIEDETVLLDSDQGIYYTLNGTGSAIWNLIESPVSLESVLQGLLEAFEVGEETAWQQLCHLIADLQDRGLVEVDGE